MKGKGYFIAKDSSLTAVATGFSDSGILLLGFDPEQPLSGSSGTEMYVIKPGEAFCPSARSL